MSEERTITVVVRLNVELIVSARLTGAADDRVAEVTSVQRVVPPSADEPMRPSRPCGPRVWTDGNG